MKKQAVIDIIAMLILMMFYYASFSKYFNWPAFERAMFSQPFNRAMAWVLMMIVPPLEIVVATLLLFPKTRYLGFMLSAALMTVFTIYITVILLGFFPRVPCSCGGIIRALGWKWHLVFNLFFLGISIIGAVLERPKKVKS
jgi:hypothetical protein